MNAGNAASAIANAELIVGLEVHLELATRTKMFTRAPSPAHPAHHDAAPNALLDPVVLALPGALPVMNKSAVEMAMMMGMALGCTIPDTTRWDRKSYFYPDLPKAYQISQYDRPLCVDGGVDLPAADAKGFPDFSREGRRIRVLRAHLEEDAGKLLHEAPGGGAIDFSIVDLNRAGTPLLEIVTEPDFRRADEVVLFAKMLRSIGRFLGVTEGVMQRGHIRFEPNINMHLTLADGRVVKTPIVEIKNLNSFKALREAIEFEAAEQPRRWMEDGREMGRGAKVTRGWDDARGRTYVQREKEDAHDYRYFPDPDLPPVTVSAAWREAVRARVPELPMARLRRYVGAYALGIAEASALAEERATSDFYEACIAALRELGMEEARAGKVGANWVLGAGQRVANERQTLVHEIGIEAAEVAALAMLREEGKLSNQGADEVFVALCANGRGADEKKASRQTGIEASRRVEALAAERGVLIVRDDAAMERWIEQVVAANPKVVEDVKGGKVQAAGRLVGEVLKLAGGKADAKIVREMILKTLGVSG